ncbi:MAG: FliH/SctL family protein [Oscillospiraceae bacterium]|nr:FliH/SctL family protein [Oscillospiraceae bacterium]
MGRIIKKQEISKSDQPVIIPDYTQHPDSAKTAQMSCQTDTYIQSPDAGQLLEDASRQCGLMISQAEKKTEEIYKKAYNTGYQEGTAARNDILCRGLNSIEKTLAQIKKEQEEYFDIYAKELRGLAVDVAEKLVCKKLDDDDKMLFSLVQRAIRSIRDAQWIKVEVSDKLRESAAQLEKELSDAKEDQRVEVELRRDADKGTCVIHTAEGVIVASVLTQLQNIRKYFNEFTDEDDEYESDTRAVTEKPQKKYEA